MPGWRDEYLAALDANEQANSVNFELIQACTQLQDRIAVLETEKALRETIAAATSPAPTDDDRIKAASPTSIAKDASGDPPSDPKLRADLAEALRANSRLETRLRAADEELRRLRARTAADAKNIAKLTGERNLLSTKLKDLEHETREKWKLVQDVQDEMITLNLQLTMAEKERDRVKKENKELVDRWMIRMAQEADAMNLANEPSSRANRR